MLGVDGDHEVLVWGVRVHARPRVEAAARQFRDVLGQVAAEEANLLFLHLPVYGFGAGGDAAGPEEGGLHAAVVVLGREAVEHIAVVRLPDKDREAVREERLQAIRRLVPEHYLPDHLEREIQVPEQLRGPGAWRDHKPL